MKFYDEMKPLYLETDTSGVGLELFIADWLSRQNQKENKDEEIPGINININAICLTIDIPNCMIAQKIQETTAKDEHLQQLRVYIIRA